MFSKFIVSVGATLLLFALAAHAAPTNADDSAAEATIPDSIHFPQKMLDGRAPSNEEIEALESGNPDSVGYRERKVPATDITIKEWLALEFSNPEIR